MDGIYVLIPGTGDIIYYDSVYDYLLDRVDDKDVLDLIDEIAKDFSDDNKIVRTFSEISSTIHLTNLTRDFYMSRVYNITSVNNPQSITLFNVLEELEENCAGSNNEKIPMTTKPVKIYVTNTSNRTPKMSKDFSLSGNKCNSKLGQIATQLNIIVNRSNRY